MTSPKDLFRFGFLELSKHSKSSQIDSKILLNHILNTKNNHFINSDIILNTKQIDDFYNLIERRKKGEPIAYITNNVEFFGLEFYVSNATLIPRQDSEILVEEVIKILQANQYITNVLDLCTGSGCLIISILNHFKNLTGSGVDISFDALEVAKKNALKLVPDLKISFELKDIIHDSFNVKKNTLVISNPPYIKTKDIKNLQVDVKNFEPTIALDGGCDGLIFYSMIAKKFKSSSFIILEIGVFMKQDIEEIFKQEDYNLVFCVKDLSGIERVLIFKHISSI
jgi:release factor glutamine methyltransferase